MTEKAPKGNLNEFNLKGEKAEDYISELAIKSFLTDWCYVRPMLKPGQELCDFLVVFGDIAIVWQVKDIKLKNGKFNASEFAKNISQARGAARSLGGAKGKVVLENPRRGKEEVDINTIKTIYRIAVYAGKEVPDFVQAVDTNGDGMVHVFDRRFTEVVLKELDTIQDFAAYFKEKEKLYSSSVGVIVDGGEEELLAYYLKNERKLPIPDGATMVTIANGFWDDYEGRPEVAKKRDADQVSYAWDKLIDIAHTSGSGYEQIAREFAMLNRTERRLFGTRLLHSMRAASNQPTKANVFRSLVYIPGRVTCCFLCYDDKSDDRRMMQEMLKVTGLVSRVLVPENPIVLGVGMDMTEGFSGSFTFLKLDIPEITANLRAEVKEIQSKLHIFENYAPQGGEVKEYPD